MTANPDRHGERLLRELAPEALGAVIRRFHDFAACEDAVQEALVAASERWPKDGMPDDPRAWLVRVASRRMLDHLRSEQARRRRESAVAEAAAEATAPPPDEALQAQTDDSLVLLFMCCHESLTTASAVALTLRAVGGLTTAEIARAFLVPETTMGQRISRAKRTIRDSDVRFRLPTAEERRRRLPSVLHVLYLIFNEGYTTSAGRDLHREELSGEAIRLTRLLRAGARGEPEVDGLLALMLLTDARRAARTTPSGALVPLSDQDRSRWDAGLIAEGVALLSDVLPKGAVGPYQLQAAIAALHDEAESVAATDWPQIAALYEVLGRMTDNPMVALNHAVATAMVRGPDEGLARLDGLSGDGRLTRGHRLEAVRAHLLEMRGDAPAAAEHYELAADRATNLPERDYLRGRAARLRERT